MPLYFLPRLLSKGVAINYVCYFLSLFNPPTHMSISFHIFSKGQFCPTPLVNADAIYGCFPSYTADWIYGTLGALERYWKKKVQPFFSRLSARCPCAIRPMAAIDINHAHLVQWGHANSQRGVYNKSPRDERWSKMEKRHTFCSKKSKIVEFYTNFIDLMSGAIQKWTIVVCEL